MGPSALWCSILAATQLSSSPSATLDDSLDYPIQDFSTALQTTRRLLGAMAAWQVSGSFGYHLLDYNPGFSFVAIDPSDHNVRIVSVWDFQGAVAPDRELLRMSQAELAGSFGDLYSRLNPRAPAAARQAKISRLTESR